MTFGKVHCGACEKVLGYFPSDNKPKGNQLELYCKDCSEKLEEDNDSKEELDA
jgi:hypothetical protein